MSPDPLPTWREANVSIFQPTAARAAQNLGIPALAVERLLGVPGTAGDESGTPGGHRVQRWNEPEEDGDRRSVFRRP